MLVRERRCVSARRRARRRRAAHERRHVADRQRLGDDVRQAGAGLEQYPRRVLDVDDAEGSPDNDVDLGGDDDLGVEAGDDGDEEN